MLSQVTHNFVLADVNQLYNEGARTSNGERMEVMDTKDGINILKAARKG